MTPKGKAKELVEKFFKIISNNMLHNPDKKYIIDYVLYPIYMEKAKQCTLITVDELIEDNLMNEMDTYENLNSEFYKNVKKEIEKL